MYSTVKYLLILLFVSLILQTDAFNCPASTNMSVNPMDYRSFYTCDKQCPRLNYCQSPQIYFSTDTRTCVNEPDNWIPRYYLSGTALLDTTSNSYLYLRQDGYEVIYTYDSPATSETFTGRYVNEILVRGIYLRRVLSTNCINVFDMEITATADRNYCVAQRLHPQSALCDLVTVEYNFCQTLSV